MTACRPMIPVTIITGFLGAGKSTLLNHILSQKDPHLRLAIIENEVGSIAIDQHLIVAKQNTDNKTIVEVTNGCLCCNIRGDLVQALDKLYHQPIDAIVVETTGLADPAPIVQTFFQDDSVQDRFILNGVVTVVDARLIRRRLSAGISSAGPTNEALEQIAFADLVILNKMDLLQNLPDSEKVVTEILDEIDALNPNVNVMETTQARLDDPTQLLHLGGFDLQRALDMDRTFLTIARKHRPDRAVSSVSCRVPGEVHLAAMEHWLETLLFGNGHVQDRPGKLPFTEFADQDDMIIDHDGHNHADDRRKADLHATAFYRYKGLMAVQNVDHKYVFQGVGMAFTGTFVAPTWQPGEERSSVFVFIGRNLPSRAQLQQGLEACRVAPALRFAVGTAVQAHVGNGNYLDGFVVAQWDEGYAYRIELIENGRHVWAVMDMDEYVRAL